LITALFIQSLRLLAGSGLGNSPKNLPLIFLFWRFKTVPTFEHDPMMDHQQIPLH